MNTGDISSSFPYGISAERTLSFQYNPDNRLWFSFVQVSIFYGRLFGEYFANQVASMKILIAMVPKVVAAWRVVCSQVAATDELTTGICFDKGLTFWNFGFVTSSQWKFDSYQMAWYQVLVLQLVLLKVIQLEFWHLNTMSSVPHSFLWG